MLRKLIIFSVCAGTSASFPALYQSNQETFQRMLVSFLGSDKMTTASVSAMPASLRPNDTSGRKVRLAADPRGHFTAEFTMNGRRVDAMIDTGATVVAINRSTARRIGISPAQMDFSEQVDTANGMARAALVTIDRLQIGQVSLDDVQAVVMDDKALSGTLVGMSFLNRLGKYQVENGTLLMVQ
jgi:aspartyl protease family protein